MSSEAACIFCKIIKGQIPSFKIVETATCYSFLDIEPIAKGHVLVIPKYHGAKLHNIPDEYLKDILPVTKKIAKALDLDIDGLEGPGYNILQNNGSIAHQVVDHVHFHLIPKRDSETGLIVGWPTTKGDMAQLAELAKDIVSKIEE
ncbi:unnamed protein product [Kuraishia capsulata CBS 1993]|uniref:HIT domain-containing protein n=1 Tax=Kuraishia capsulata CBS 1993 TaxID=1382522 RepID=W6MTG0_9ASCO|nr:uncharacterized protein KUCA_T00005726001 [Kuraishia capsulata CBS 1993]CDK29733.1 unnamed protein product [Kuraishia capsulata CBS 1993]